ncbi:flavin reductase family protein [Azorhizobium doebereinerae]|uniref:flavin reductase family protein n=1 Tax=Azorhizobium doebereinerae TaxID=281091 RepID=UPI00048C69E0|nr:flavin reductase family protein [Azorhizobium doebereinerae]
MNDATSVPFDLRAFRQALGHFATGVAVVTARADDGEVVGMTMSSFNSVSLDPPLVLFSVARNAHSLPAMLAARGYGVNVLARDQEHLSNRFAKALEDKWSDVDHVPGHAAAPLLTGALAHFECAPYAHHDGGDHVIFLARVVRFANRAEAAPLIFFRGRYHGLAAAEAPST